MTYKEKFSLKDQLFNRTKLEKIAQEIKRVHPMFAESQFVNITSNAFPSLELKERISLVSQTLFEHLPKPFEDAVAILLNALPEPCNPSLSDNDFGDFIYAAYGEFIEVNGCNDRNLDLSLQAIAQITTRFSMEFSLRAFINKYPEKTFEKLHEWASHEHYHVRRLASEGSRPKLPWGKKISTPPDKAMLILNTLHADTKRFVTRSVANHLNDLSKINPDLVFECLFQWKKEKKQNPSELNFITRHALRTLIKKGDKKALTLIGVTQEINAQLEVLQFPERVKMNDSFQFLFQLTAQEKCTVLADYGIHFQNRSGVMNGIKIFKIKQLNLEKNEVVLLGKKHPMIQFMATRTLYPGKHKFVLQINGDAVWSEEFELV
jgi:3-methyladenine DNA glycosylase AlkC